MSGRKSLRQQVIEAKQRRDAARRKYLQACQKAARRSDNVDSAIKAAPGNMLTAALTGQHHVWLGSALKITGNAIASSQADKEVQRAALEAKRLHDEYRKLASSLWIRRATATVVAVGVIRAVSGPAENKG